MGTRESGEPIDKCSHTRRSIRIKTKNAKTPVSERNLHDLFPFPLHLHRVLNIIMKHIFTSDTCLILTLNIYICSVCLILRRKFFNLFIYNSETFFLSVSSCPYPIIYSIWCLSSWSPFWWKEMGLNMNDSKICN